MWDTVVLGLGGVGAFALRAVAREVTGREDDAGADGRKSVLGIEQFTRGHDKGSSHGKSRVYRLAYFEHPNYVPWIKFSVKEFLKLQDDHNIPILMESGVLLMVPKDDTKLIDAATASSKEHSIPVESLEGEALAERFPQFLPQSKDMIGLYEPGAGVVKPENAILAALEESEQNGATIWEGTKVLSMEETIVDTLGTSTSSRVVKLVVLKGPECTPETIYTKTVLVAAGAWTSKLVPSYEPHVKPIRQLQTWVDISSTANPLLYDGATNMPAQAAVIPGLRRPVYTLPADLGASHNDKYSSCIKLGIHGRDCPIDPDSNDATITPEEVDEMKNAIKKTFNAEIGSLPLTETKPCMYSMTKDDHFIIGAPKGYSNTYVVAGLSGHGFKMVPALGQMLADFALGKELKDWNAEFCSPSRFNV